jgi:hypothetical protein
MKVFPKELEKIVEFYKYVFSKNIPKSLSKKWQKFSKKKNKKKKADHQDVEMRMCLLDLGSRISGSGFGTSLRFSIGMIHVEDLKSRPKRRPRKLGTWIVPAPFECI